ncbi:MAG: haloacid dehalogenase type II [Rickettsiales bacterium]|nr:haloacid dehalogenase type II [Rickettsiales bacterium]OUV79938.1 MAG: haloacid dehalogenase, type II [Rickettsiales bacterium TMED131]
MKAFFFDIFGTLVDWRSSIIKGIKKLDKFKYGDIEAFVIYWRKEYQPILNKVNNNTLKWQTLDLLHYITLEKVCKKMNVPKITEKEKKYLVKLWHQLDPWDDSVEGINLLNKKYITASLSNGNIILQKNLFKYAQLNLDFIFSAEHFKKYKPHKKVYLGAVKLLNLKVDECALVASHKSDLLAASKLGLKTIFIERKNEYGKYKRQSDDTKFNPDIKIRSLTDLTKKLSH